MPTAKTTSTTAVTARSPVIAILGHIDHGKSALLDYIRKTNVVASEVGGITQHLSAYEVVHKDHEGRERTITFLDTPGHEAFAAMRSRGAAVADIAILAVSAEEGAKAQTLEGLKAIKEAGIPYIVALTKIDKPQADIERTKTGLLQHEIFLEGLGGDVPFVPLSSKTGEGIPELLDMMLLVADLAGLTADTSAPATGVVIEANLDPKKGITATLIVKNGTLKSGAFVVAGGALAPTRIMQNFLGKSVIEAGPSQPVRIIGWNKIPVVGFPFQVFEKKKDAEAVAESAGVPHAAAPAEITEGMTVVPLIIKTDTAGTLDAILYELDKIKGDRVSLKILNHAAGSISESDIKTALGAPGTIIAGFNVSADPAAADLALRNNISIHYFDIIYKFTEWLTEELKRRRPTRKEVEITGRAKILKLFSATKDRYIIGARMTEGALAVGNTVKIFRRDLPIGEGAILNVQQQKVNIKKVESGEFGSELKTKSLIAPGDTLEAFIIVEK